MRWLLLLAGVLAGCATAGVDGGSGNPDGNPGTDGTRVDAGVDAPPPDASIMSTLTQTTSNSNVASNSVTCSSGENSWYRVFALADHGVTGAFNVTQVTFGVQESLASPSVQVKIGTYAGTPGTTLDLAMVTPINAATVAIANQTNPGNNVVAPITGTIPAGSKLIVEIFKPGANTASNYFFVGASNAGETKSGYVRAPTCNDAGGAAITVPKTPASVGVPTAQLNITVTGTH